MEYLFTFIEGICSFISPCLLPMVPIYISYFTGKDSESKVNTIINALSFVLGFTTVFILLSIFASTLGIIVSQNIQYIKIIFAIIIITLGLNYMDILKIGFINKTIIKTQKTKNFNFIKSFIFGILFSISWTPCIGTFLSSALLVIAKKQHVFQGIILIIVYSMGLGIPFIISAILIDKLKNVFDFIKRNYRVVKKISGIILISMGIYMFFR